MRKDVVIGVDCGTSYTKLSTFDSNGTELMRRRERSPAFNESQTCDVAYAATLWRLVERFLVDIIDRGSAEGQSFRAITIAGMSPVLTLFDPADPDRALTMPYWYCQSVDGASHNLERSIRRINLLRERGAAIGLCNPVICDLIGYLNYRLTQQLTINTITASELGFRHSSTLTEALAHSNCRVNQISLLSPSQSCGICRIRQSDEPLIVCAGSPDSFSTALGAGANCAGSKMIYLGTFGSLLDIVDNLSPLAEGIPLPQQPYRWRISVPGFGAAIEKYADANFGGDSLNTSLRHLDIAASATEAGAQGVVFHLPIWDEIGAERGSFGFEGSNMVGPIPKTLGARAVLEAIAYVIRSRAIDVLATTQQIYLAGGGAQSAIWRQIIADTLGLRLIAPRYASEALGAAIIASKALGWTTNALYAEATVTASNSSAHSCTEETARRAALWYRD
jgi:sugar (pentulose or hexulose) kinase